MSGFEETTIIGNLGRKPEVREVNGTNVANFSVAVTRRWKNKRGDQQESTNWYNVDAWDGLASVVETYLKKGSRVFIKGVVSARAYEKDGKPMASLQLRALSLVLLDSATDSKAQNEKQNETHEESDIPF